MKWLTIEQIKVRSDTVEGALEVSHKHWCQLYAANAKELKDAYNKKKIYIDQRDCGLCQLYFCITDCYECPLKSCDSERTLYRKAKNAFSDWMNGVGTLKDWKSKAKAVRDKLKKLIDKF